MVGVTGKMAHFVHLFIEGTLLGLVNFNAIYHLYFKISLKRTIRCRQRTDQEVTKINTEGQTADVEPVLSLKPYNSNEYN